MGLFHFFYPVCNSVFFDNFFYFPRVFGRMFMTHVWPKFQVNFANLTLTFFCIIFCVIFCLRQIITLRVSSSLCLHSFGYTCRATIYVGLTKNEGPLSILKGAETSSLLARLQNKQKRSNKKVTEICPFFAGKMFFCLSVLVPKHFEQIFKTYNKQLAQVPFLHQWIFSQLFGVTL